MSLRAELPGPFQFLALPVEAQRPLAGVLPADVRAEVQRILDGAARRVLRARLNAEPIVAAAGSDVGAKDDGGDQGTLLVEREAVPLSARADRHGRRRCS